MVDYEYDALNRLRMASTTAGATLYGYDAAGNLAEIAASNGVLTLRHYDVRNRLTEIRHTAGDIVVGSFAYQLSPTGRRQMVTEADGSVETYTYDALDRLTAEVRTGTAPRSTVYEYDAVGNRTRMVRNGVETLYAYDEDDHVLAAGPASFAYDGNGNLVLRATGASAITYSWDFENRLVSSAGPSGAAQFTYDVDGNRVERRVGSQLTRFLVDMSNPTGMPQVLEERDELGNLRAHNVYGNDLLGRTDGAAATFYQHDALGSTRLLTDGTGTVTDTYAWEGYGDLAASTGSTANPYLFAGEQFEPALGLYNLRARNYDPSVGRFLGRDPETGRPSDPRSQHPFLYAHADPINLIDPTGRFSMIELSVSLADLSTIQSVFAKKLVTDFFLPIGKILSCQMRGAFKIQDLGLALIANDLPGGHLLFDESRTQIHGATRTITKTGVDFVNAVVNELQSKAVEVKIKFGSEVGEYIGKLLLGAAPEISLGTNSPPLATQLTEFKGKAEEFLNLYTNALDFARSGDICQQWNLVTAIGIRAFELIPGF